jgi:hypothetical protein
MLFATLATKSIPIWHLGYTFPTDRFSISSGPVCERFARIKSGAEIVAREIGAVLAGECADIFSAFTAISFSA